MPQVGDTSAVAEQGLDGIRSGLHVAIIMDGNGRWAKARGLPRALGHRAGVKALKATVAAAADQGIACLTVFGFSTENWSRPAQEVNDLMGLLKSFVDSDLDRLHQEGVRVRVLGRREGLGADILATIARAETLTQSNSQFLLQVAFNYGGRADITDAARHFACEVAAGRMAAQDLTEASFETFLSTALGPCPDLIIRTSGEKRLSNFLLWESAYAELVFQDVLWPDYGPEPLKAALAEFKTRQRRFGGAELDDVLAAS
jgi:undecaprenyl diphosphate synthase